jgi:hypothetical protein
MLLPQYKGKLPVTVSSLPCSRAHSDQEGTTPMTFSTPIFATAFALATAALLALRSAASARQSMVKVRSNQRHPANTKTQG